MNTKTVIHYPSVLTYTTPIRPTECGADKRLSVIGAFTLLLDAAAIHSEKIGTGCREMADRHRFWLMTRAGLRFYRRPTMMEEVTVTTWPHAPRRYLCERLFTVEAGGELLLEGRQEWAVLDTDSGRPVPTGDIYPEALSFLPTATEPAPFLRPGELEGEEAQPFPTRVSSPDIDFGGHVNNVQYLRMMCATLTSAVLQSPQISGVEVAYRSPCYEGEALTVWRRDLGDGYHFTVRKEDGRAAVIARFF